MLRALLLVLALPSLAAAQQTFTFAWDPGTDGEPAAGYRLYAAAQPAPGQSDPFYDAGAQTTATVTLEPGQWYVYSRAYSGSGALSGTSNVLPVSVAGPAPVDCQVSAWQLTAWTEWTACSNGMQSRTETWTRSIITQPANGGAACPALSETRTATQACTMPPPTTPTCTEDPLRVTVTTWPTRRTVPTYSSNYPIARYTYTTHGQTVDAIQWTDTRGCTVVTRKP